uniref:Ig-like domain-containing protein n=1 Tax=Sparus aurata TaxID=8175 RepID=A0A671U2A7_SPAAU
VQTADQCWQVRLLLCPRGEKEVTVKAGEDAMLPCQAQTGASITMIKWNRSDLESDKYVFFFRENRPRENYQLPSFHGRVELKDPQMTEGDASVVLKNVTANDSGIYECVTAGSRRKKRALIKTQQISIVQLQVTVSITLMIAMAHVQQNNKKYNLKFKLSVLNMQRKIRAL